VNNLLPRAQGINSNKLERFIKEEIQKPHVVGLLLSELRQSRPLLYKFVEPTELQVTFFLKSNAKKIKDALIKVGGVKPSPIENPELEEDVVVIEVPKTSIFVARLKPLLKAPSV
jgi:hypothetical protein